MSKSNESYEVWVEKVGGKWTVTSDEDGTVKLFPDQREARKAASEHTDDGMAIRACIFRRILVEEINCAGKIVAKRMGIDRPGVKISSDTKIQVGPKKAPESFRKPDDK